MIVRSWESLLQGRAESPAAPAVLTIGVFDGIHIGHQRLLREVVANRFGAAPVVGSFRQNPGRVLATRPVPGSLLSPRQKLAKFAGLGVAALVLIDFSPEISTLTGKDFLAVLARAYAIRQLVVGYNFRMGRGRATGVNELGSLLSPFHAELTVVTATLYRERAVSSSRIREAIVHGRFLEARDMLGGEYCLDLAECPVEVHGGTAVLARSGTNQLLPGPGRYRSLLRGEGGDRPAEAEVTAAEIRWPAFTGTAEIVFSE